MSSRDCVFRGSLFFENLNSYRPNYSTACSNIRVFVSLAPTHREFSGDGRFWNFFKTTVHDLRRIFARLANSIFQTIAGTAATAAGGIFGGAGTPSAFALAELRATLLQDSPCRPEQTLLSGVNCIPAEAPVTPRQRERS